MKKELILYNIEESLINRGFLLWKSEHHEKIYIKDAQIKDKVLSLKDIFIKNNNNKLFDDFTLKIDGKGTIVYTLDFEFGNVISIRKQRLKELEIMNPKITAKSSFLKIVTDEDMLKCAFFRFYEHESYEIEIENEKLWFNKDKTSRFPANLKTLNRIINSSGNDEEKRIDRIIIKQIVNYYASQNSGMWRTVYDSIINTNTGVLASMPFITPPFSLENINLCNNEKELYEKTFKIKAPSFIEDESLLLIYCLGCAAKLVNSNDLDKLYDKYNKISGIIHESDFARENYNRFSKGTNRYKIGISFLSYIMYHDSEYIDDFIGIKTTPFTIEEYVRLCKKLKIEVNINAGMNEINHSVKENTEKYHSKLITDVKPMSYFSDIIKIVLKNESNIETISVVKNFKETERILMDQRLCDSYELLFRKSEHNLKQMKSGKFILLKVFLKNDLIKSNSNLYYIVGLEYINKAYCKESYFKPQFIVSGRANFISAFFIAQQEFFNETIKGSNLMHKSKVQLAKIKEKEDFVPF